MSLLKNLLKVTPPLSTKERGEYIEIYHEFYMVCDGCDAAIPIGSIDICPYCHGYRFDFSTRRVKSIAKQMQKPGYESYSTLRFQSYQARQV